MIPKILFILMLLMPAACTGGGGEDKSAGSTMALIDRGPGSGEETILNPSGPFMTSPVWLMDGSGLVARGYGGHGIYLIGRQGNIEVIHSSFVGFMEWTEKGKTFCLHREKGARIFSFDGASGAFFNMDVSSCTPDQDPFDTERKIYDDPARTIYYDIYRGKIRVLSKVSAAEIEHDAAWGAAASPDGSKVAYCLGHLGSAMLVVYDIDGGDTATLAGAQPAWFPEGDKIVFAKAAAAGGGDGTITGSDLFMYDTEQKVSLRLTNSTTIIEMQPAVSPDGKEIAFSDWRSGAIMVIPVRKEVTP